MLNIRTGAHRFWRIQLAVCALLVLAFASPSLGQQTAINYMHDTSHAWTSWLVDARDAFEAENPDLWIEILYLSRETQIEQITLLMGTGQLPDVAETFAAEHYGFARSGAFADLNPFVARDRDLSWDQFFPKAVEAATIAPHHERGGTRWMLPISIWTLAYVFNHDDFNAAGLSPPSSFDRPWNWEDFIELGQRLTAYDEQGQVVRYGAEVLWWPSRWPIWVRNAGGWMFDSMMDPAESRLLTEPVRTAFNFMHRAWHQARVSAYPGAEGPSHSMFIQGPAHTAWHVATGEAYEYSFGAFPMLERAGSENVTIGLSLSAASPHPEEAWRFMKFLATDAASSHIAYTNRPVAWGPVARNYHELVQNPSPWEHIWIELVASTDGYERPFQDPRVMEILQEHVDQIAEGTAPVDAALEAADSRLRALFAGMSNQ